MVSQRSSRRKVNIGRPRTHVVGAGVHVVWARRGEASGQCAEEVVVEGANSGK